jgi:hypothetical protein
LKLIGILKQPYPNNGQERSSSQNIVYSFWVGFFVVGFLIVFQPFGIVNWHTESQTYYLIGFGIVTFAILLLVKFGVYNAFPSFFIEEKWTIGKEISVNLLILGLITSGNFLFVVVLHLYPFNFYAFLWSFLTILAIGVFPVLFNVLIVYQSSSRKYTKNFVIGANEMIENEVFRLTAENKKDNLEIRADKLLFIESADNYAQIFYRENQKTENVLLRSSLSLLEGQINASKTVRCHRSFIVNLKHETKVTGNAQGYKLHFSNTKRPVPVARKFCSIVDSLK